jgi:hypothetical protein
MNDVRLHLSLSPGSEPVNPPATARMTAVLLTLDICASRASDTAEPEPLSETDKVASGRLLHVNRGDGTNHLAKLILHKAEPADFAGRLLLTPLNDAVRAFRHVRGQASEPESAVGRHFVISNSLIPQSGLNLWVEGLLISKGAGDTCFRLGMADVDPEGDRVAATVFRIDRIKAYLPATPCGADRLPRETMRPYSITSDSRDFNKSGVTVLRDGASLKLKVYALPEFVELNWSVQEAADDANDLGGELKCASIDARTATLSTAGVTGSFHISAYGDANGNHDRDTEDDGLTMNINAIEIRVTSKPNAVYIRNNQVYEEPADYFFVIMGPQFVLAPHKGFHYPEDEESYLTEPHPNDSRDLKLLKQQIMTMVVGVELIGGGPQKTRGLSKIVTGFLQNVAESTWAAVYADGSVSREIYIKRPDPDLREFEARVPKSTEALLFPILDGKGERGADAFLNSSSDTNARQLAGGGERRIVGCSDSPSLPIQRKGHDEKSPLSSFSGGNRFSTYLTGFSKDFDQHYVVYAKSDWFLSYGLYDRVKGWRRDPRPELPPMPLSTDGLPTTAEKAGVERCGPVANASLRWTY